MTTASPSSVDRERDRLEALRRAAILDTRPEAAYDAIVQLASEIAGTKIALVSLVDEHRQWFKARVGLDVTETGRDVAFCDHAINDVTRPFIVDDALADERFSDNPLVTGGPNIRFYAGFPVTDDDGLGLGTLCVIDDRPRSLDATQIRQLERLASVAEELIRVRALGSELGLAQERSALFERGFELAGVGMQLVRPDGTIVRANQAFASMIGRTIEQVEGHPWWDFSHPDTSERDELLERQLDAGEVDTHDSIGKYLHSDGTTVWAVVHVVAVRVGPAGGRLNLVQITDITSTIEAQQRMDAALRDLRDSQRLLMSLIEPLPDPILLLDSDGTVVASNKAAAHALHPAGGLPPGTTLAGLRELGLGTAFVDELSTHLHDVVMFGHPRDIERIWFESAGSAPRWLRVRLLPVVDDEGIVVRVFVSGVDVTTSVENEQRLAALALVDPLTGAANRPALYDRLDRALVRLDRGSSAGVAIAMLDLDHFKAINDTHGHETGDRALMSVVKALRSVTREQDSIARLGGDEFVVMVDDIGRDAAVDELTTRIRDELTKATVPTPSGTIHVNASIGLAWTNRRLPGAELIAQADAALMKAKRHGRGRAWVAGDDDGTHPFSSDASLRRDLLAALDRDQFELHYQPIVDQAGRLTGAEGLLRWAHPDHGLMLPATFLGVLIDTGMIASVGRWALRRAVIDAGRLADAGCGHLGLHVNLSPGEIANTQVAHYIRDLLDDHGTPPSSLVIEVTEQALMGTIVSTSAIAELASTGVELVLDDFGTGASSLSHLRFPDLAGLKLDRSFVSGIGTSTADMAILSGVISIARQLGLDVIAEGVETPEQLEWLSSEGCSHMQGHHFGHAVRFDELPLP